VQFLQRTTEPILEPIRRLMPPLAIDISPIIAFFAIIFLKQFLVRTLYDFAARIQ
jgi:YggT family protein